MEFATKKKVLIVTIMLSIGVWILYLILPTDWCDTNTICRGVYGNDYLGVIIYGCIGFIATVLPFSLITFFLHENVFETWKKFAKWSIPIVLTLMFFITQDTGGSNFFSMDFTLFFLGIIYGLFFLISLAVIAVSALRNRKRS